MLRIVNRQMKAGLTFDPEKIEEIKEAKARQRREEFLQRARAFWKGGN